MYYDNDFAVIVPLANEEKELDAFVDALKTILDRLESGTVYFIVDKVSKDNTLQLCNALSEKDIRTIFLPELGRDMHVKNDIEACRALPGPSLASSRGSASSTSNICCA